MNRSRIVRLSEWLGRRLFGPYLEAWQTLPQDQLDRLIDAVEGYPQAHKALQYCTVAQIANNPDSTTATASTAMTARSRFCEDA